MIDPPICLLSLSSKSKIDPAILRHLMRTQKINLTLKCGGLVVVGRQAIGLGLLELDHHRVGAGNQAVDEIFAVHGLEVASV